jgi:hypothetical protein
MVVMTSDWHGAVGDVLGDCREVGLRWGVLGVALRGCILKALLDRADEAVL